MTISAGLKAKQPHACSARLHHQRVEDLAGYPPASRTLLHPHPLNLSPIAVMNESAGCERYSLYVTRYEKANFGLSETIKREMVIALGRIEPCRFRLAIP